MVVKLFCLYVMIIIILCISLLILLFVVVFSLSGNSTLLLVDRLAWGDTNPTLVSLTHFLQAGILCLGLIIILCIM